jgi:hypothetical protein
MDGEVIGLSSNTSDGFLYSVPAEFIINFMKQIPESYDFKIDRKKKRETAVEEAPVVGSFNYLITGMIYCSINWFTLPLLRLVYNIPPEVTRGCLVLTVIEQSAAYMY